MTESEELESQAVALVTKYRALLMIYPAVKAFFKRLAIHLKWTKLENAL